MVLMHCHAVTLLLLLSCSRVLTNQIGFVSVHETKPRQENGIIRTLRTMFKVTSYQCNKNLREFANVNKRALPVCVAASVKKG